MRRQRVIGVPRMTLVRSCIIDGEAVACGGWRPPSRGWRAGLPGCTTIGDIQRHGAPSLHSMAILGGNLYVPFGGHFGDCGQYRGFVVSISLSDPRTIKSWATPAREEAFGRPAESAQMGHRC